MTYIFDFKHRHLRMPPSKKKCVTALSEAAVALWLSLDRPVCVCVSVYQSE